MPTLANNLMLEPSVPDTSWRSFESRPVDVSAPQRFDLLMVTTHPESADAKRGEVVIIPTELRYRSILIDLTEVTRIDSWGLGLFIEAMQRINALGGKLILFGICENVLRIFETAKLDQVFDICSTREEALVCHFHDRARR